MNEKLKQFVMSQNWTEANLQDTGVMALAEAIVRECSDLIMDEVKRNLGRGNYEFVDGIQHGSEVLKNHFGFK